MPCANNRNMCAGCLSETLRHRKLERLESEILEDTASNETLEPLLQHLKTPISLKEFRMLMKHLQL